MDRHHRRPPGALYARITSDITKPPPFALSRLSLSGLTSLYCTLPRGRLLVHVRPAPFPAAGLLAPTPRLSGPVSCSSFTSPTTRQNPTSEPFLRNWIDRPATHHAVPCPVPPSPRWPRLLRLRSQTSTTSAPWPGRTVKPSCCLSNWRAIECWIRESCTLAPLGGGNNRRQEREISLSASLPGKSCQAIRYSPISASLVALRRGSAGCSGPSFRFAPHSAHTGSSWGYWLRDAPPSAGTAPPREPTATCCCQVVWFQV